MLGIWLVRLVLSAEQEAPLLGVVEPWQPKFKITHFPIVAWVFFVSLVLFLSLAGWSIYRWIREIQQRPKIKGVDTPAPVRNEPERESVSTLATSFEEFSLLGKSPRRNDADDATKIPKYNPGVHTQVGALLDQIANKVEGLDQLSGKTPSTPEDGEEGSKELAETAAAIDALLDDNTFKIEKLEMRGQPYLKLSMDADLILELEDIEELKTLLAKSLSNQE